MSASSIARWNAIPLERSAVKRPREQEQEAENDGDDDISIASRSPSPPPENMIVDEEDISRYDDHILPPPREVITVDTRIKPSNKGFAMLAKLGWVEGTPLGLSGEGRIDPIPFHVKQDLTGLGKISQDVRIIEETVSSRREMDSERQQKETEEQRRAREDLVARKVALESEISSTLRPFYCTLCEKQFKNVAQYDEHCNSYAHHHKARFKDMQANIRLKPKEEVDKRKEKERRREEKELRKLAAAAGIKMAKPHIPSASNSNTTDLLSTMDQPVGLKKTGWATVGSSATLVASESSSSDGQSKRPWATVEGQVTNSGTGTHTGSSGIKKSGWETVPSNDFPTPPSEFKSSQAASSGLNTASIYMDNQPQQLSAESSSRLMAPTFRAGGWSTLEIVGPVGPTVSSASGKGLQPEPPQQLPLPRTQPGNVVASQQVHSNWQQFQKSNGRRK